MMAEGVKKAARNVDYSIEVVGDLPDRPPRKGGGGGGGGHSVLEDALAKIVDKGEGLFGRWVVIARYNKGTAATAAANVLRQRHGGDATVEGWAFATRRVEDRTGLFANYDPSKVEPDGRAKWDAHEKERLAGIEKRRKETEAAKARGEKPVTKRQNQQKKAS